MKNLALVCLLLSAASAHAEGLTCDQVLNPNVSGSAEVSVPKIVLTVRGSSDRDLTTNWDWMGKGPYYSLDILTFNNECGGQIAQCSTDSSGVIQFVTQYSGGENERSEGSFDPATNQLHVKFSESGLFFRKTKADVLLQCH